MPTFSITAPDGSSFRIQAADQQTAMQQAQKQWLQSKAAQRSGQRSGASQQPSAAPAPTSSGLGQENIWPDRTPNVATPSLLRDADPRQAVVTPLRDAKPIPGYVDATRRQMELAKPGGKYGGRGFTSQATASFNPYVQYGAGFLGQGVENLVRSATGQRIETPAATSGQAAADNERTQQANWASAHPLQASLGTLSGFALMPPETGEARIADAYANAGPTTSLLGKGADFLAQSGSGAGRIGRDAILGGPAKTPTTMLGKLADTGKTVGTGAGFGAAYGAADARDGQHLQGMLAGAGMGALTTLGLMGTGALLKPLAEFGVNQVRKATGPVVPGIGGGVSSPDARRAATYVGKTLRKSGMDLPDLQAAGAPYQATRKDITSAEAMGPRGVTALSALARREGQTGGQAKIFFGDRRRQMGDRILDDVSKATGVDPEGARGNIDAVIASGQKTASPMFDAVRATPGPIWNANLASLAERPSVKEALKLARATIEDTGRNPNEVGLAIDPDTGLFAKDPVTGQPVPENQPKAEAWEVVRRILGDLSKPPADNAPAKAKIMAQNAGVAQRDLTAELAGVRMPDGSVQGGLIPGYRDALDTAGDYLSAKDAFNKTRGFLFGSGRGKTAYDMSQLWDGFQTPGEQSAARHAVAADIYDQAMRGELTPSRWSSPDFQAKLNIAFPGKANDVLTGLQQETELFNNGNQITPGAGSQTQPLRQEMAEQDAVNPAADFAIDTAMGAATGFLHGGGHGAVVGGLGAAAKRGLNAVDTWLRAPGMSATARDEAGRLLMASPNDLADYLQTYRLSPRPLSLSGPSPAAHLGGGYGGMLGNLLLPKPDYQLPQPSQ